MLPSVARLNTEGAVDPLRSLGFIEVNWKPLAHYKDDSEEKKSFHTCV
jgi:hypothetical protein